jgi:hypothetical protein
VVIDFKSGHLLEAHEQELQVNDLSLVILDQDQSVVGVLQMQNPPVTRCGTSPEMWPASPALESMMERASAIKLKTRGKEGLLFFFSFLLLEPLRNNISTQV